MSDLTMELKLEQRARIKSYVELGKSVKETLAMLRQVFGDKAMSRTTCFEWHARFRNGRMSLEDSERSGRPSTVTTFKNVEKIRQLVREDRRITVREVAGIVNGSFGTAQGILKYHVATNDFDVERSCDLKRKKSSYSDCDRNGHKKTKIDNATNSKPYNIEEIMIKEEPCDDDINEGKINRCETKTNNLEENINKEEKTDDKIINENKDLRTDDQSESKTNNSDDVQIREHVDVDQDKNEDIGDEHKTSDLEEILIKEEPPIYVDSDDDNNNPSSPSVVEVAHSSSWKPLPENSQQKYEISYKQFMLWRKSKNIKSFSETVLMAYFGELSETKKPNTLYTQYSMLRSTLIIHHDVDINNYLKLKALLKDKSDGYVPKKSNILSSEEINQFLYEAPDEKYLFTKVALIFGVNGSCRKGDLSQLTLDDVRDLKSAVLVNIKDSKTKKVRTFTITDDLYDIYKKYASLRPEDVLERRFFLSYHNGKCTKQPVGINKFGLIPKQIASYLNLDNPELYTGHCFRRSSVTLLSKRAHFASISSQRLRIRYDQRPRDQFVYIEPHRSQTTQQDASKVDDIAIQREIQLDVERTHHAMTRAHEGGFDFDSNYELATKRTFDIDCYKNETNETYSETNFEDRNKDINDRNESNTSSFEQVIIKEEPFDGDFERALEDMNEDTGEQMEFETTGIEDIQIEEESVDDSKADFQERKENIDDQQTTNDLEEIQIKVELPNSVDSDASSNPPSPSVIESNQSNIWKPIPEHSHQKYEISYKQFMAWRKSNNIESFSENVLMTYFRELAQTKKPNTLYTQYSMLRSTLSIYHDIDLTTYLKLKALLKDKSDGYVPKKTNTLTAQEINKFLYEAPDEKYLFAKVALIFGINGSCRKGDLCQLTINDVRDLGSAVIININDTKTKKTRTFTVTDEFYDIYKKYANLRPEGIVDRRFFLNYQNQKCTRQPVGINKFGNIPKQIAAYLKLDHPELYTGHCFRRSSLSVLGRSHSRYLARYSNTQGES